MTRTAMLLALILIVSTSMAIPAEQVETDDFFQWTGSTEQKIWGLMTIWASTKYSFPHFDRMPGLDWDRTVQEFIPRVIETENTEEYYHLLMELVALLEDSHTVVVPPWGYFKPGHDMPPLEIQIIDDRFFIARVGMADELDQKGIVPGLEIVEINGGTPIEETFEDEILKYYSRGSKHADQAILPIYLLFGPAGETVDLTVRDHDGNTRTVQLERNSTQRDGSPFMYRFVYDAFVASTVESRLLDDQILYVKIPNFDRGEISASFHQLLEEIDLSTAKGMVIDLRFNLGGSNAIGDSIVSCLIDETVTSPTMRYRHWVGAYEAWGREPIWSTVVNEIQPRNGRRFMGPLVILTGPTTNSSAEDFAIELQSAGRATLIGQTTAGGAGNGLSSSLPGGGHVLVSTFTALTPDGVDYVGKGIEPDLQVPITWSHLIEGSDPVLEAAREYLHR